MTNKPMPKQPKPPKTVLTKITMEVVHGKGGWHLRMKAPNGTILNVSEIYYSKWNAKRAARKLGFFDAEIVDERGN
jgi:hypothetical protein